jgi:hypothetical protein
MTIFALLGSKALWLTYAWLLSAIVASYISARKGYGERPGLASGLLLNVLGVVIWLVWPARPDSRWKQLGVFGTQRHGEGGSAPPAPPEKPGDGS